MPETIDNNVVEEVSAVDSAAEEAAEVTAPPFEQNRKEARKIYSLCSFTLLIAIALSLVVGTIGSSIWKNLNDSGSIPQSISSMGMFFILLATYLIAYPVTILVFRIIPKGTPVPQKKMKPGRLFSYFTITITFMIVGNIIGNVLAGIFSSGQSSNSVNEMISSLDPFMISLMLIAAPVFEEFIFRKLLIDRLAAYDEKAAILFSALAFALFHENIYQFFYTFGLGLVMAYVYTSTRKIQYSIILHFMFNLLGSVIAPLCVSQLDLEGVQKVSDLMSKNADVPDSLIQSVLPGLMIYGIYTTVLYALIICGVVFLIVRVRQLEFREPSRPTGQKTAVSTMFLNAGTIIFTIVCIALMVLSLVGSMA